MIRFNLRCDTGHEFEAWFRSGADYDEQQLRGLLACAACGSAKVEKAVMAPSVARTGLDSAPVAARPPVAAEKATFSAQIPPEMREMLQKFRKHVRENSEDVGPRFAEEARRIHNDEAPARGIHGKASREFARHRAARYLAPHPP